MLNNEKITQEQEAAHQIKTEDLKQKIKGYDRTKDISQYQSIDLGKYALLSEQAKQELKKEDCVKEMDKIILYAKTATIRDRQMEERKKVEDIYRNKEGRLDVMMELERLKEMSFKEEKEKELKRQQKAGSRIIIDQIKEAEIERLKKKDQLEKEKLMMVRQIQLLAEEEKRNAEYKRQRNAELFKESMAANQMAYFVKEKRKIDEKTLDLKIKQFQQLKDAREEALLMERKRIQAEKELEVQRLREKQEKALDKQAELDAVKAKRAYQANEKKERLRLAQEGLAKEAKIRELIESNEKQKRDQAVKLAEEARQEHLLFEKIIEKQNREIDEEIRLKEQALKKRLENCHEVR